MSFKRHVIAYWLMLIGFKVTDSTISDGQHCGYQRIYDYVRPNENTSLDEFPWMVQLLNDRGLRVMCSGSLISSYHVLTAAYCVTRRNYNITMVRFGDHNIKTEKDCVTHRGETECSNPVKQFQVKEIYVHPSYNRKTGENDIALIELSQNISFSDYIRPICLPNPNSPALKNGEQLLTSGWGHVEFGKEKKFRIKRVTARLITYEECKNIYTNKGKTVSDDKMCAIEVGTSITCQRDGGSPLMYSVKTRWEQVGIQPFGSGCGDVDPVVYTKVSSYLDWIEEKVHPTKFNDNLDTDIIYFPILD